jgi:hypothetical protein
MKKVAVFGPLFFLSEAPRRRPDCLSLTRALRLGATNRSEELMKLVSLLAAAGGLQVEHGTPAHPAG